MDSKFVFLLIAGLLLAGCSQAPAEEPPSPEGVPAAAAPPAGAALTLEEARQIALGSPCTEEGSVLTDDYFYNNYTETWWFSTDIEKEGCSPACVVSEETRTAEINWRCTGLIQPEGAAPPGNEAGVSGEDLYS